MTAEQTLARLVHSRQARQIWRAQGLAVLGVASDVAAELDGLDEAAIEGAAAALRRHILERAHSGVGTIVDAFPRTIAAWRARHPGDADLDELAATFLDSSASAAWRETPADTDGIPLEEAFYQFATDAQLGERDDRETERLTALVKMLALDGAPAYQVPACMQIRDSVVWAIDDRSPPVLFAAVGGQILIGPITRLVADLLTGHSPEHAGLKHGVTSGAARSVRKRLCEMRLLSADV